jgi:NADH-quinone oxidoreductase subunit J
MSLSTAVFYLIALITVVSAGMVAFSRNIIYSAFSLLGTFMGVAGLYVFLGADFVAAVQLLIYVGGILVLILFAVMLTHRITDVQVTNRAAGRIPALIIIGALIYLLIETIKVTPWVKAKEVVYAPTTATIGDLFLSAYLLPFELASLVLLGAMIGAVVLSRKEIRE